MTGAEFIVTQLFYDNKKYFSFVKNVEKLELRSNHSRTKTNNQSKTFNIYTNFNTNFPEELLNELEKCKTNEEIKKVGIEWSKNNELIDAGVPVLHFYTMGKGQSVKEVKVISFKIF